MIATDALPRLEAEAKKRQRIHGETAPGKSNTWGKNSLSDSGKARELANIKPRFKTWTGDSPVSLVVSKNLHRRHLGKSQTAMISTDALPLLAAEAKKRQGARTDIKAKLPECDMGQARDKAAELFGVSPRYVSDAKLVRQKSPKLADAVRQGTRTDITEFFPGSEMGEAREKSRP
jgi:hypothetical protein